MRRKHQNTVVFSKSQKIPRCQKNCQRQSSVETKITSVWYVFVSDILEWSGKIFKQDDVLIIKSLINVRRFYFNEKFKFLKKRAFLFMTEITKNDWNKKYILHGKEHSLWKMWKKTQKTFSCFEVLKIKSKLIRHIGHNKFKVLRMGGHQQNLKLSIKFTKNNCQSQPNNESNHWSAKLNQQKN